MRKADVVRPPINYVITHRMNPSIQIAWFISEDDAWEFFKVMTAPDYYEIVEVRR